MHICLFKKEGWGDRHGRVTVVNGIYNNIMNRRIQLAQPNATKEGRESMVVRRMARNRYVALKSQVVAWYAVAPGVSSR